MKATELNEKKMGIDHVYNTKKGGEKRENKEMHGELVLKKSSESIQKMGYILASNKVE